MIWTAIAVTLAGLSLALMFWPELTCWLPSARNDRREGYADGMGGKFAQVGRSEAYYHGHYDGVDDAKRLRTPKKRRAF